MLWAVGFLISGTIVWLRGAGLLKLGVRLLVPRGIALGEPRLLPVELKLERLVVAPPPDVPMLPRDKPTPPLMPRLVDVPPA